MRKLRLIVLFCFMICSSCIVYAEPNFTIYPTQNYWTQIELDTRDGKMWQVQISPDNDKEILKISLNLMPLTDSPEPGRFMLSPTKNMYNFVLLDTVNGRTWQVQWSTDLKYKRGIVAEIK